MGEQREEKMKSKYFSIGQREKKFFPYISKHFL